MLSAAPVTPTTRVYFTAPTACPSCAGVLTRDGEYLVCRSTECEAQASGAIKRWVAKIGVLHLGETVIEAAVEAGLIEDIADLYAVDPDAVAGLYLGGRKVGGMADRGFVSLKSKMKLPLHVIVGSIGIPLIGRSMAKTIVDGGFDTLSKMMKAKTSEVAAIPGVGETKARSFVEGFQQRAGLIAKIIGNGVTVAATGGHLAGKSFCMTGFRDAAMQDAIEKAGGTIKSSVSKGLTYLIAQDKTSTSGKAQKARDYGTKVIDISDAWWLINNP
jgi:DNA ligase (NAD+)